jgi:hypothetical protein
MRHALATHTQAIVADDDGVVVVPRSAVPAGHGVEYLDYQSCLAVPQ